jgi:hypothetical protein
MPKRPGGRLSNDRALRERENESRRTVDEAYKQGFEGFMVKLRKAKQKREQRKGRIDDMNDASYYEDKATLLNRVERSELP